MTQKRGSQFRPRKIWRISEINSTRRREKRRGKLVLRGNVGWRDGGGGERGWRGSISGNDGGRRRTIAAVSGLYRSCPNLGDGRLPGVGPPAPCWRQAGRSRWPSRPCVFQRMDQPVVDGVDSSTVPPAAVNPSMTNAERLLASVHRAARESERWKTKPGPMTEAVCERSDRNPPVVLDRRPRFRGDDRVLYRY